MKLYVVGKTTVFPAWEFCGVFDDEDKARLACPDDRHFVGPCELNINILTDEQWPGSYYPRQLADEDESTNVLDDTSWFDEWDRDEHGAK